MSLVLGPLVYPRGHVLLLLAIAKPKETRPTVHSHVKLLLASYLLTSHYINQSSPKAKPSINVWEAHSSLGGVEKKNEYLLNNKISK
jgi:hypothetical protein